MKLKYNINFRLERRRDKETGELISLNTPINFDFSYEGKRLTFYTGYRIDADRWTDILENSQGEKIKVQRVKKNAVNSDGIQYNRINNRLDNISQLVEKIYIQAKANEIAVDNVFLEIALNKELGETRAIATSNTLFWYKWEQFLKTHNVSEQRQKQYKSTRAHLQRYEEQTHRKLAFEIITPKLLANFETRMDAITKQDVKQAWYI